MWRSLSVLARVPELLIEIASLLREQCLLLREHHLTVTGRPSQVPQTPNSIPLPDRPKPARKLVASDVTVVTRADRLKLQEQARDKTNRPWATGETLGPQTPDQ